jgi:hypothetical protein
LASTSEADLLEFSDTNNTYDGDINHSGDYPVARFLLNFPNGEGAPWSYEDQYDMGNIEDLIITLTGDRYRGGDPIDIFLSFEDDPSLGESYDEGDWTHVASVEPTPSSDYDEGFSIVLDFMSPQQWTLYNEDGFDTAFGNLTNDALSIPGDFANDAYDTFWVGYGCHFDHLSTGVYVSAREQFVPEPATLSLFGLGLIGLGVLRKKRK